MAHQRLRCVALLATLALFLAPAPAAAAYGGLAGDDCDVDDDCMSRKCVNGACAVTTCGLSSAEGGKGDGAGFCIGDYTIFNPYRVCTFGFNQCTRAECCDTLSCDAGVPNVDKPGYCDAGTTFAGSRLCMNSGCAKQECCVVTQCDGAGGVPVEDRSTLCPAGEAFDNVGICAGGQGSCTSSECCTQNVRLCSVAFDQLGKTTADCPTNSALDGDLIFDNSAGELGGCCVQTTCAAGVPDGDKAGFCTTPGDEFRGLLFCPTGSCRQLDCCRPKQESCAAAGLTWNGSECVCADETKAYVPGSGCVCREGFFTAGSACTQCPHGTYSAVPNADPTCTSCPSNEPYTAAIGSSSVEACYNYCDEWLLTNTVSACSNGGTCSSLSGEAGSFSCACPTTWMSASSGSTNNCDAPTTLLRLRALAGSGVTLPGGFALNVGYVLKGDEPDYAAQAPDGLACALTSPSSWSTPTVPACTAGAGALSTAGGADNVRNLLNAKVRLSTNYAGDDYTVEWACSDGTGTTAAEFNVVLPGPAAGNPNGQTLVCTAIVRAKDAVPLIKVKLASGSVTPVAATPTRAAQLTFLQGSRPICVAGLSTSDTTLDCPFSDVPFASGQTGTLGVSNIDMERYTLTWTCGETTLTTNALGVATSLPLPAAGQTSLVCEANFVEKRAQLTVTATSSSTSAIRLTATQTGMSEPCTATIPGSASGAAVALSCPVANLKSGTLTTLTTTADLTQFLVEFSCNNAVEPNSRVSATVTSSSADGSGAVTACSISITPLPPLLQISIVNTASAPNFFVIATQRPAMDACTWSSAGANPASCMLGLGMMPSISTTLTPRGLDVNKYQLAWDCVGGSSANPNLLTNIVSVVLRANPNTAPTPDPVVCTGTVTARSNPITVKMVVADDAAAVLTPEGESAAKLLVRQSHQSQACAAAKPTLEAIAPSCPAQALRATLNTRTTLSTLNVNLSVYQVSWACVNAAGGAERTTTIVSAGVARVDTLGPDTTVTCTATITAKPPLLMLVTSGTGPSSPAWSLTARQTMHQGRACIVATTNGMVAAPLAPSCESQPFLPTRTTVLATTGLDLSRWAVAWSCSNSAGALSLSDVFSSTNVNLANSKSVTLGRDPNVGGLSVTCTATITQVTGVLNLVAAGNAPNGVVLTAQQSTQSAACTFAASTTAGAPTCSGGIDTSRGLSVELGATGLGADYFVSSWACDNGVTATNRNSGAATTTALPASGVTTCTATIASSVAPVALAGPANIGGGATFTARQGSSNVCTFSGGESAVDCTTMAASTATTLSVAGTTGRPTFACTTPAGSVPVSRLTATSSIVMAPPAGVQVTCTLTLATDTPIITLTSSLPTTLKVEYVEGSKTCASAPFSKSVTCNAGAGSNEFTANTRVKLSQEGLTAAGYYRWMCGSSAAAIERDGEDSTATATVLLPSTGTLSCSLIYWSAKPSYLARRMML